MKSALLALLLCAGLSAQVSSGSFYGQAADQSGGVLSGVRIVVRQEKTGFVRETETNENGLYRVPELEPGLYSVSAERKGFRTVIMSSVVLEINQTARVDLQMELGPAHDSTTVTGSVSPLQTDDSSLGYHFSSSLFTELPLEGRNVLSL